MNHATLMCSFECFSDLLRDLEGLSDRDGAMSQALCEVLALHELEDEECDAVDLFEAVNARDIRVIERGQDVRLTPEPRDSISVARHLRGDDLDRDLAV